MKHRWIAAALPLIFSTAMVCSQPAHAQSYSIVCHDPATEKYAGPLSVSEGTNWRDVQASWQQKTSARGACNPDHSEHEVAMDIAIQRSAGYARLDWKYSQSGPNKNPFSRIFYMICFGDHYSYMGAIFNPVLPSGAIHTKDDETQRQLAHLIISKWAYNRPADTWGCKTFDDRESQAAYLNFLTRAGFQNYAGSGDFRFEDIPKSLGYVSGL